MEQQADSVTTAVPTSFTPAVESHDVKFFSSNQVAATVDPRDSKIIVCCLPAPNTTYGPFLAKRERRTFWTACASCKTKNKHSIENLNCHISCLRCGETFEATEVSRPRKPRTATTENAHSGAIVTSPGTMVEPSKMTPTAEIPLPKMVKREITAETALTKRVKRDINVTQAPNRVKRDINATQAPKRVKRDINVTQPAGKHGGNLQGINAITKDEINRLLKSKSWNEVMARINGNNVVQ